MSKRNPSPDPRRVTKATRQLRDRRQVSDRRSRPKSTAGESMWSKLARSHSNHPALDGDVIYALPDALLNEIARSVPDFLSKGELQFERCLSATSESGFFLKQPFYYSLLPNWNPPALPAAQAKRQAKSAAAIQAEMRDLMRRNGRTDTQIDTYLRATDQQQEQIRQRQLGYVGWLLLQPAYWNELTRFVAQWELQIRHEGGFPGMPISLMGATPLETPPDTRAFHEAWMTFCLRWGLDTVAGWHLPIPIRPELGQPNLYQLSSIGNAGITLYIPWYLLRAKDIDVYALAAREQIYRAPDHLREWVSKANSQLGLQRYGLITQLYVIFELCLQPRYGDELRGKREPLTATVAKFLSEYRTKNRQRLPVGLETVRKLRREMNTRLNRCVEQTEAVNLRSHRLREFARLG